MEKTREKIRTLLEKMREEEIAYGAAKENVQRLMDFIEAHPVHRIMANSSSSRTPLSPVALQDRNWNNNDVISPLKRTISATTKMGCKKRRRMMDAENIQPDTPKMEENRVTPSTPLSIGKRRILSSTSSTKTRKPAARKSVAYIDVKAGLTATLPERLLCRDVEIDRIRTFLDNRLDGGFGGSLYVSGAPGTGKTAVLTKLLKEYEDGEYLVETLFVNCMTLKSSTAVYAPIISALSGKQTKRTRKPVQEITKQLTKSGNKVVVVLDEIDQIDSKHEEILYSMFEWPSLPNSRLILIGIANALDLTDRILPRLMSNPSCRPELLHFRPYTREQVITILKDRLGESDILDNSAVSFCAGKVASLAGDMRKALDLCRRAVDRAEQEAVDETPNKVGIGQVMNAANDSDLNASQGGMPLQQKIAVCAHLLTTKRGKLKEVPAGKIRISKMSEEMLKKFPLLTLYQMYSSICRQRQVQSASQTEFMSMCEMVEAAGVFSIKKHNEVWMSKIKLNLNEDELRRTLQNDPLITTILNQKP